MHCQDQSHPEANHIQRVLVAKSQDGLSYNKLVLYLGVMNTYAPQLLLGQAKLPMETTAKLQATLPSLDKDDLKVICDLFPMRSFDDEILKEPNVYHTYEATTHYGKAIKSIINEQCGDRIMSAIDF
jgi:cyanate lyase